MPVSQPASQALSAATLLSARIAIENLTLPQGNRIQELFQRCLEEVSEHIPELAGLSFLNDTFGGKEKDIQVEVVSSFDVVIVMFSAIRKKEAS